MVGQVLGVVQKGGFSGFARGLCRDVVHLGGPIYKMFVLLIPGLPG
jgi:hypothetical protein